MPSIDTIRSYSSQVLADVEMKLLARVEPDPYYCRLALFHADMHGEALTYLRQTLDLPPLPIMSEPAPLAAGTSYVDCAGGELKSIWVKPTDFAFDNELPSRATQVPGFSISRQVICYDEFLPFVEDGGYQQQNFWSEAGWLWKVAAKLEAPARWRIAPDSPGHWQERWFGSWRSLHAGLPLCHINAYEAEAYCRWAKLRLPTEDEWQWAASHDEISWGSSVWEWTSDWFAPFEGFVAGPYREYSAPWFGSHRVLRGGAFATHARIQHPSYRNFYLPERNDVFAGFRTCQI